MTDRFKDFGSSSSETAEPISFKIHGEEFHCVPTMQGKFLLDMVSKSQSDDPLVAAGLIGDFFARALTNESLDRFNALTDDKDRVVSVETLGEIVSWLTEVYSGRPNQQPEDSSSGQ